MKLISELSPSCREAARLQSLALDYKLSLRQRLGLRLHLFLCKWCGRYGEQLRFLRRAAREHPERLADSGPPKLSNEARARIKHSLRSPGG